MKKKNKTCNSYANVSLAYLRNENKDNIVQGSLVFFWFCVSMPSQPSSQIERALWRLSISWVVFNEHSFFPQSHLLFGNGEKREIRARRPFPTWKWVKKISGVKRKWMVERYFSIQSNHKKNRYTISIFSHSTLTAPQKKRNPIFEWTLFSGIYAGNSKS